jgi:uncharacterized membrane protein YeaQ/YmgE (transglycosylase-associated protein family)
MAMARWCAVGEIQGWWSRPRGGAIEGRRQLVFDFAFDMGFWGALTLLIGGIVLGVIVQLIGENRFGYEWIVTAIAAIVGGVVASEFIVDWRAFDPVFDGLALIPALVGGLVVGIVVGAITRFIELSYTRTAA